MEKRGQVQVYTGDGKGKTTAALGLALRALGAGFRVFIGQFVKGTEYSELNSLSQFPGQVVLRQFGHDHFITKPGPADISAARAGLEACAEALSSGEFDLVILDEGNIAIRYNLFSVDELLTVLTDRAAGTEAVITGRNAHPKLIDFADLVTEMREVKHYYTTGLQARIGIEK